MKRLRIYLIEMEFNPSTSGCRFYKDISTTTNVA
jgi:hypothetical protein